MTEDWSTLREVCKADTPCVSVCAGCIIDASGAKMEDTRGAKAALISTHLQ